MKNIRKVLSLLILIIAIFTITGCGSKNITGSLEDLMTKVYENVPDDKRPMMLGNTEITKENAKYYLGTSDIEFEEGLASESMTGSIAHSVVLLRVKDNANIEEIKNKIKDNIDPRKWICVEAEKICATSSGNVAFLVMSNAEMTDNVYNNFKKIAENVGEEYIIDNQVPDMEMEDMEIMENVPAAFEG